MTNIPTELLRTFVAVVDKRSFTRAAQSLGITQPAVSAQVKRLQRLLGGDLMDKRAPGVALTQMGETVLDHARQLLAINDQIVDFAGPPAAAHAIRVGLPGDFVGEALWRTLARFREGRPDIRFHVKSGLSESLVRDVRQGGLDLALTVSGAAPHDDARFHWTEDLVWVCAPQTKIDPGAPVPLVSRGEKCLAHRQVADALERAGLAYKLAFTETSVTSLVSAVGAGLGVMALPRCMSRDADLAIWDDAPLPPLPKIVCNVCVRNAAAAIVDRFAEALADAFGADRATSASDRQGHAAG
jgi:DNA-binding transcriptional LysR family regulator